MDAKTDQTMPQRPPADARAPKTPRRRLRRLRRWIGVPLGAISATLVAGLVLGVIVLQDGVALSGAMVGRVETQIARSLPPGLTPHLSSVEIRLGVGFKPRVRLGGLRLIDDQDTTVSQFPDLTVAVARRSFLGFRPRAEAVILDGTALVLRRDMDGILQLGFDAGGTLPGADTLAGLVAGIEGVFDSDMLGHLRRVYIRDLTLTVDDLRAGRTFTLRGGQSELLRTDERLQIVLDADLDNDAQTGRLALRLSTTRHSPQTDLSVDVSQVPARLLAEQSVYLSWLKALDAPVSAQFRGGLLADGGVSALSGAVELGAGQVQVPGLDRPVQTDSAKAYVSYAPDTRRLTLQSLDLASDLVTLRAEGYAYLHSIEDPFRTVMGQLRLSDITLQVSDHYDAPHRLDAVIADLRVDAPAGRVDLGQVVALQGAARMTGAGRLHVTDNGPDLRFDAILDRMEVAQARAFWPLTLKPRTRAYFGKNMSRGALSDVSIALRQSPGAEPRLAVTGAYDDVTMRMLPKIPPVEDGRGHFSVVEGQVTVDIAQGVMRSDTGGAVDVAGSVFQAVDLDQNPGKGIVSLAAAGPVSALLGVSAPEPLNSTAKLGIAPDAIGGQGRIGGEIRFPMKFDMLREEVSIDLSGTLAGLSSDVVLPGQTLRAGRADLHLSNSALSLVGAARVSDVPVQLRLDQPLADGVPGQLGGSVYISAQALEKLGISLPEGFVEGATPARFDIALDGGPPILRLTSDLKGMGLRIAPLGWRKLAGEKGALALTARLGPRPEVSELRITGAGLSARGQMTLSEGGGLERARFDELRIGSWLDVQADLIGAGAGQPMDIAVRGGRVDLAGLPADKGAGQTGPGTPRGEITLALDRITIGSGIALTGVTGRVDPGRSLSARITGRVNGAALVSVALGGTSGGTAIRVRSDDAGGVLTAAGLLDKAKGGTLDLILNPRKDGRRLGEATIGNLTVVEAPALTKLLSAVSVIGVVEQITAGGLFFVETTVKFSLGDDNVLVTESRAEGPSMGLTARGLVGLGKGAQMELSGVVSPFYLINRVYGALLARKGEGLIGFNYTMDGPRKDPKVRVNPLSILTPGALREIFRRPLPEVQN